MKYKILKQAKRGSQYEILYDVFDDDGKLIGGNLVKSVGSVMINKASADKLFADVIQPMFTGSDKEKRERIYTEDEIVQILIDKKYLNNGETLKDLPVKRSIVMEAK